MHCLLSIYDDSILSAEELARFGIAQRNHDGKPQFIHRTFAVYFVAEFLINQFEKERVQELLRSPVLAGNDSHIIRAFLAGRLEGT